MKRSGCKQRVLGRGKDRIKGFALFLIQENLYVCFIEGSASGEGKDKDTREAEDAKVFGGGRRGNLRAENSP